MRFEVNGQPYFLNYLDEEGRWILLRPGPNGVEQVPIEEDSVPAPFRGAIIPFGEEEGPSTIN